MRDQATQDLITAVTKNDTQGVRDALQRGANPNVEYIGNTPLMMAARNAKYDIIFALYDAGADFNAYVSGLSAFMVAVMHKQFSAADLLQAHGADIDGQWNPGYSTTALHSCIILDAEEGVDDRTAYLISRGADTTIKAYVGSGLADTVGDALEQARLQPNGRGKRLAALISETAPTASRVGLQKINHTL